MSQNQPPLHAGSSATPANPFAGEPPGVLFGLPMPMARAMGLRGVSVGGDQAQVSMDTQADMSNSRGQAHGGAIATLLDCTLAAAVRAHDPAGHGVATIDMTLHFVATGSGTLTASAHCDRRGRSISFARGEVRDAAGALVATATGSFKLMPRTPVASGA